MELVRLSCSSDNLSSPSLEPAFSSSGEFSRGVLAEAQKAVAALSQVQFPLSFAKNSASHKSRPVTMLEARPHAINFKRILDFGDGRHRGLQARPSVF